MSTFKFLFKNILHVIARFNQKFRFLFLLKILGLVLGLTSFMCVFLLIRFEASFDRFLDDSNQIYRVTTSLKSNNQESRWALTNGKITNFLMALPEVSNATKLLPSYDDWTARLKNRVLYIPANSGFFVDEHFFEVFSFSILYSESNSILKNPNSIVITQRLAIKLFGREDVVGEILPTTSISEFPLKVTAVIANVPKNTHLQFDYVISGNTLPNWKEMENSTSEFSFYVYIKCHLLSNFTQLKLKVDKSTKETYPPDFRFYLQEIRAIHFDNSYLYEPSKGGNKSFINILGTLSILLIACSVFNYMLLSSSQLFQRNKELAVRKLFGSYGVELGLISIAEAIILSMISGLITLVSIEVVLSKYSIAWFDINVSLSDQPLNILFLLIFSFLTGILAGLPPAIQIVRLNTIEIIQNRSMLTSKLKLGVSSIFISIQFAITTFIFIGCVVVINQISFLQNKKLGFQNEYLINLKRPNIVTNSEWEYFGNELRNGSDVKSVSSLLYNFFSDYNAAAISLYGESSTDNDPSKLRVQWNSIDANLIPTLGLKIIHGRNFEETNPGDVTSIIINETAQKELGDNVIGKEVVCHFFDGKTGKIVGVVEDFHFQSFNNKIKPVVFILSSSKDMEQNLLVRFNRNSDVKNLVNSLDLKWRKSRIEVPLEYTFMDDSFALLIQNETKFKNLVIAFSCISIVISLLGLFGMVSLTLENNKKDIVIRKVLGASSFQIILLSNIRLLKCMILAIFLVLPIAVFAVQTWLQNFAYQIELSISPFIFSVLIILLIVITTISLQTLKYALVNPTKLLKVD